MKDGIAGIYLAAGTSSRMGVNKLSLPLGGGSLGSLALQAALESNLDNLIVVTKMEDDLQWIAPSLSSRCMRKRWRHVPCAGAVWGQSYSLRCGLQACIGLHVKAVIILLADQPFITADMINQLIDYYKKALQEKQKPDYVAASYQGLARPPILFSDNFFPVLLTLQGDQGARQVVRNGLSRNGTVIEYEDPQAFYDVDTWEAYRSLLSR